MGLELHVKGLPTWMNKMNPDKMNAVDRHHVMHMQHHRDAKARKACLETEKNGARCIF